MTKIARSRYLTPFIKEDLREKMVFLSGPRQVAGWGNFVELQEEKFTALIKFPLWSPVVFDFGAFRSIRSFQDKCSPVLG